MTAETLAAGLRRRERLSRVVAEVRGLLLGRRDRGTEQAPRSNPRWAIARASPSVHTTCCWGGVAGTTTWNRHGPAAMHSRTLVVRCSPPSIWVRHHQIAAYRLILSGGSGVGAGGSSARRELVAGGGALDQPPDQPASAQGQRREHVLAGVAPDLGAWGGPIVRGLLRKTPDSRHFGLLRGHLPPFQVLGQTDGRTAGPLYSELACTDGG
jgi:hypothetical protein